MLQAAEHSHADLIFLSGSHNWVMDSMDEQRKAVGDRISKLRAVRGLSQPELAAEARISQPSLWSIENGKTVEVTARTLIGLCRALGTTWEYLWDGEADTSQLEAGLLAIYRQLSDNGKAALLHSGQVLLNAEANFAAAGNGSKNAKELTNLDAPAANRQIASRRGAGSGSALESAVLVGTKPDEERRPAKRVQKPRSR